MLIKNHLTKFIVISLTVFGITGCTTTATTSVRHSANYESILSRQREVAILPAKVAVSTYDVGGTKNRMDDYEVHLENTIIEVVKLQLEKQGFKVKKLSRRQIHEQKVDKEFSRIRNSYDEAAADLYAKGTFIDLKEAGKVDKNIGQVALEFSAKTGDETIIMVDYVGSIKTNGARTRDFLISMVAAGFRVGSPASMIAESSHVVIGIIDAKTGQVIWMNRQGNLEDIYTSMVTNLNSQDEIDKRRLNKIIEPLFKALSKDTSKPN